ncbi:MAG: hypothetical protein SO057_02360 [Atopobiaceae bacterium]|nr:hypothetical protein [Atopobiaceae bacterium]
MSKTAGFSQYVCDRCGKSVYTLDSAPEAQSWRTIKRVTADGVDVTRLLCPDCASAYRTLASSQDTAFGDFMANRASGQEA